MVVVNSGPLMALAKLGLLDLLPRLYEQVSLPTKGTLGVIVQAYRSRLLTFHELENAFEAIIEREDIWISEELCRSVLRKSKDGK